MSEPEVYVIHTTLSQNSPPLCGAVDPGPIPLGVPLKFFPCDKCVEVGKANYSEKHSMAHHADQIRELLRQKLRGMSEADRNSWKEQVAAIAVAGLIDPPAAPALYTEGQLLAALYAISGIRAGLWQLKKSGARPTYATLERALLEHEMITVALVEGTPL